MENEYGQDQTGLGQCQSLICVGGNLNICTYKPNNTNYEMLQY